MILLLAADEGDADRYRAAWPDSGPVVAMLDHTVPPGVRAGMHMRLHHTDYWPYNAAAVSALQTLRARGMRLDDPTGLLGPVPYGLSARSRQPAETPPIGASRRGAR